MLRMGTPKTYTGFSGDELIASGAPATVLQAVKVHLDSAPAGPVLVFDDTTGQQLDFDLSQPPADSSGDPEPPRRGPGRPRLGVVAREVTLLPRHWEWLNQQPNGASAALRRLVDQARKSEGPRERARLAAAATGRVMTALAGNRTNFEEAYRALDAGNRATFAELTLDWPSDVRKYLLERAEDAFTVAKP